MCKNIQEEIRGEFILADKPCFYDEAAGILYTYQAMYPKAAIDAIMNKSQEEMQYEFEHPDPTDLRRTRRIVEVAFDKRADK